MKSSKLWLCLAPITMVLLDHLVTTFHQPAEYWGGDYAHVQEMNAVVSSVMNWHSSAFLLLPALWIALFTALICAVPRTAGIWISIVITFGHTIGTESWLEIYFPFTISILVVVLPALLLTLGIERSRDRGITKRATTLLFAAAVLAIASGALAPSFAVVTPQACVVEVENKSSKPMWVVATSAEDLVGCLIAPGKRQILYYTSAPFPLEDIEAYLPGEKAKATQLQIKQTIVAGKPLLVTIAADGKVSATPETMPTKFYIPKWRGY